MSSMTERPPAAGRELRGRGGAGQPCRSGNGGGGAGAQPERYRFQVERSRLCLPVDVRTNVIYPLLTETTRL